MLTRTLASLALCSGVAHADRTTEVQVDVLGFIAGRYSLTLDHAITPNAAFSLELSDTPSPAGGPATRDLAIALPVYASHVFRGFFVAPGLVARGRWSYYNTFVPDIGTDVAAEVVVGWAWTLHSGVSIAAAIGVESELAYSGNDCNCSAGQLSPTGYMRAGYAF